MNITSKKSRKKRGCQYRLEDGQPCNKPRVAMHTETTEMLCKDHQHASSCCYPLAGKAVAA